MRKNLDKYLNKPTTKIIILTLTNNCNLNCIYCYEHCKESTLMSFDTAIKIIDREMTIDDGSDFVCFYYFSGEPFLAFNTIKRIHSYLQSKTWNKGWFGFSTTNGTLIHNEAKQWLHDNQPTMEVYLSLDGTREMHNRNRSNSYDDIDVDFFANEYPFAKMTVTEKTLPDLAEGAIYLHENGFQVSANLGYGVSWSEKSPDILADQLQILKDYYLNHPKIKPATVLDQTVLDLEPFASVPKRFCGVGPMMRSYDIDGEAYPCHAFAPLCLGKEKAEKAKELDFSCPLSKSDLDEKCQKCPVAGYCPTCYGINFYLSGNVYHVNEDHCKMMKVQFLANAMFKFKQYKSGLLSLSKEDELKLLRNITAIQSLSE